MPQELSGSATDSVAGLVLDVAAGRAQLHRLAARQPRQHLAEPAHALEPPASEQRRVADRRQDAVLAGPLVVLAQHVLDDPREVVGVDADLPLGPVRVVPVLRRQVDPRAGHAPVAEAGDAVAALQLAVVEVARVAVRDRPDLQPGPGVAPEHAHVRLPRPGTPGTSSAPSSAARSASAPGTASARWRTARPRRSSPCRPAARPPGRGSRRRTRRRGPISASSSSHARPVAGLRQPDRLRIAAERAPVRPRARARPAPPPTTRDSSSGRYACVAAEAAISRWPLSWSRRAAPTRSRLNRPRKTASVRL